MKIAHIEIFRNTDGTVTISDAYSLDDNRVVFPIEMIPTISKALSIIYDKSNGQSEIIFEDGEEDE